MGKLLTTLEKMESYETRGKLLRKASLYITFLRFVPFVRMIAVCNNLAFGLVDEESDIDLFIVAKRGRLFTARILVTAILSVLGVRRHGKKIKGRFCLSFFVDEDCLNMEEISAGRDYYLAYWVYKIIPFIDEDYEGNYYSDYFLAKNRWAEKYWTNNVPEEYSQCFRYGKNLFVDGLRFLIGLPFLYIWGNFIENSLRKWQLRRARRKARTASGNSSLVINEHMLKFHLLDRRAKYNLIFHEKYGDGKIRFPDAPWWGFL